MATYQKKTLNGQASWDSSMTLGNVQRPDLPPEFEIVDVVYRDDNNTARRFTLRLYGNETYDLMRSLAIQLYAGPQDENGYHVQSLMEALDYLHPTTGDGAGK